MFARLIKSLILDDVTHSDLDSLDQIETLVKTIYYEYVEGDFYFYRPKDLSLIILCAAILQEQGDYQRRIVLWQPQFEVNDILKLFQKYQLDSKRLVVYDALPTDKERTLALLHLSTAYAGLPTIAASVSAGGYVVLSTSEMGSALESTSLQQTENDPLVWRVPYEAVHAKVAEFRASYRTQLQQKLHEWMQWNQHEIQFDKVLWMGQHAVKDVLDMWIYQEIIYQVQPEVIVEIGSRMGGSTLFFAHMLDLLGKGTVVSVDIDRSRYVVSHERIVEVTGDSNSPEIVSQVSKLCENKRTMVVHDGDHKYEPVLTDLKNYGPLVSPDSYLIVEDGNVDLYPHTEGDAALEYRFRAQGPLWAIADFMADNSQFAYDRQWERYWITYNPFGYLKRLPTP